MAFMEDIEVDFCVLLGYVVAQLVETLHYKPEGHRFDSWWCHRIFHELNPSSCTVALGSTKPLTEMRTKEASWGGKGGLCVRLTTLPPSCADGLKSWEHQPPGILRACPGCIGIALTLPFVFCVIYLWHVSFLSWFLSCPYGAYHPFPMAYLSTLRTQATGSSKALVSICHIT